MDDNRHNLERRLANYRPVVEGAMAKRPPAPKGRGHKSGWVVSLAAAGTVAAGAALTLTGLGVPA